MPASNCKFLLVLLTLCIGVQAFISCTLHFPEENLAENLSSSSEILGSISSSSKQDGPSSSSSAEYQPSSSGSDFENSSSSIDEFLSSSGISSSDSDIVSSSSSGISSSSDSDIVSSSSSSIPSSSSLALSSSSTIKYGSMTYGDQTYKTVVIGTQTWMAQNLNYAPSSGRHRCYAQGNGNGGDTWLAPDKPADQALIKANCDKYGRLYDWATARTVCPNGWHLPDTSEWNKLRKFIEDEIFNNWEDVDFGWDVGTKLKAVDGWKKAEDTTVWGVDSYGFGAIGSGYCVSCEALSDASGYYAGEKEEAHWWSATEYVNKYTNDATQAYKSKITYNKKVMTQEFEKKADYLYSVRCIKN